MSDVNIGVLFADFDNALRYVDAEWRTYNPLSQEYADWNELALWLHTEIGNVRTKLTAASMKSASVLVFDLRISDGPTPHITLTREQAIVLVDSLGRLAVHYAKQRNTFATFSDEWKALDVLYRKVHMLRDKVVDTQRVTSKMVTAEEEEEKRMKIAQDIEYDALHQTGFPEPTEADVARWTNDIYNDITAGDAWGGLSPYDVKKYQERARVRIVEDWRKKILALRKPEAQRIIVDRSNRRTPGKFAAKYEVDYWVEKFLKDTENDADLWKGNVTEPLLAQAVNATADAVVKIKVPDEEILRIEKPPLAKMPAAQAKMPAWA